MISSFCGFAKVGLSLFQCVFLTLVQAYQTLSVHPLEDMTPARDPKQGLQVARPRKINKTKVNASNLDVFLWQVNLPGCSVPIPGKSNKIKEHNWKVSVVGSWNNLNRLIEGFCVECPSPNPKISSYDSNHGPNCASQALDILRMQVFLNKSVSHASSDKINT